MKYNLDLSLNKQQELTVQECINHRFGCGTKGSVCNKDTYGGFIKYFLIFWPESCIFLVQNPLFPLLRPNRKLAQSATQTEGGKPVEQLL